MRDAMWQAVRDLREYPDHAGLAHDVWAHLDREARPAEQWLDALTGVRPPEDYARARARWEASLDPGRDCYFHACAEGRLLVGHGNPALNEVGITLHHTWGVPVIPGSALKGLLAHYVAACYGAESPADDPERLPYAGNHVVENGLRDGDFPAPCNHVYRRLFGAPAFDLGGATHPARRGELTVHDALWVSGSTASGPAGPRDRADASAPGFLARDVLTVHQRGYYQGLGLPSDHESPNPVAFVSVPPGTRFLITLSCDDRALCELAAGWLAEALDEWGIGGKTAAGYGRLRMDGALRRPSPPPSSEIAQLEAWLEDQARQGTSKKVLARAVMKMWIPCLVALDPGDKEHARRLFKAHIKKPRELYAEIVRQLDLDA